MIAAAIRRATGTAGGLQIGFGYFYPSGRVLDSFSHFPPYEYPLMLHNMWRVVGGYRYGD